MNFPPGPPFAGCFPTKASIYKLFSHLNRHFSRDFPQKKYDHSISKVGSLFANVRILKVMANAMPMACHMAMDQNTVDGNTSW